MATFCKTTLLCAMHQKCIKNIGFSTIWIFSMISCHSLLSQLITTHEHQTLENVTFGNILHSAMVWYCHVQCKLGNSNIEKHNVWHRPVIQKGRPWSPNSGKHNVWQELQKLGLEGSVLYLRKIQQRQRPQYIKFKDIELERKSKK